MLLSESGLLKPKAYENGLLNLDQNTPEPPVLRSPDPLRNMGRDERRWRLCKARGEERPIVESPGGPAISSPTLYNSGT